MDQLLQRLKVNKPPVEKPTIRVNVGVRVAGVKLVDETKQAAEPFDRGEFLKSVRKPILVQATQVQAQAPAMPPTVAQAEPAQAKAPAMLPTVAQAEPPTVAQPTVAQPKKLTIRKKAAPKGEIPPQPPQEGKEPTQALTKGVVGAQPLKGEIPPQPPQEGKEPPQALTKGVVGAVPLAQPLVAASDYYLNNREFFVNFISKMFIDKYKDDLLAEAATPATCPGEGDPREFSLMTHQRIVRDYLNLYTPYRGLLLFHGLGSGKTCSSIAIAEGMKSRKNVIVMTPASLQRNYREELKKCGDEMYKKNHFWEFTSTKDKATIATLAAALSIPDKFIIKQGGAWMVNMKKNTNYDRLTPEEKDQLNAQIEFMLEQKYSFINYNGLRATKMAELTKRNTINPFDNKVVIIDEAHNLVSRIVNKLGRAKSSITLTLYSLLMKAQNVKIVLLSGTPIINYPNEIGILFNILRGYITTWSIKLDTQDQRQINTAFFQKLFNKDGSTLDLIDYNPTKTTLVITRNPMGFSKGQDTSTHIDRRGDITNAEFLESVTRVLRDNRLIIQPNGVTVDEYKALPDTLDEFKNLFMDSMGQLKNLNMFKRRILGLNSYFRSAQEGLMPKYDKKTDFIITRIEMSDFQFGIYEEARAAERKLEKKNNKKMKMGASAPKNDLYEKSTSTYRIFSRAFCNYVFPRPAIARPLPDKKGAAGEEATLDSAIEMDEDTVDAVSAEEKLARDEVLDEAEDLAKAAAASTAASTEAAEKKITYKDRIQSALEQLEKEKAKYLTPAALKIYSPKFAQMLSNITDPDHKGIHLMYSQFRSLEGIGIFKLILEANGFAQFKLKKTGDIWRLAQEPADVGKPLFALYTGTETSEEKEHIRNILNNDWKYVPDSLVTQLKSIAPNNNLGEIIKLLMITSSGAEGISLKNVRYVHITEPYWHPVRIEQVIGRARRICSHQALPPELRTVQVFLYLMVFSAKQKDPTNNDTIEMRLNDRSRKDSKTPVTTDETLYEIASAKEEITQTILTAVKETSIDCVVHAKNNVGEKLKCFAFGPGDTQKFAYMPSYSEQQTDEMADKNQVKVTWKATKLELEGAAYALNKVTNEVYDLDSYNAGQPIKVGDLIMKKGTYELKLL
jgi:hypothetical protein